MESDSIAFSNSKAKIAIITLKEVFIEGKTKGHP
jgi:hypothetical protein